MILTRTASRIIASYAPLGERRLNNGARLIGHIPHKAPQAYLHILFPAATRELMGQARDKLSAAAAFEQYTVFLSEYNGGNFFLGSLALNGIRRGPISRSAEDRQPFDLVELNSFERPKNAPLGILYIGSYNWDGSLIGIEPDGTILVCRKSDATPLARWPSLSEMLSNEIVRLGEFFDSEGRVIDETAPTVPSSSV
jgi:hypothetical protein